MWQIHKMPGLPEMLEGVIDLRGQINYIRKLQVQVEHFGKVER